MSLGDITDAGCIEIIRYLYIHKEARKIDLRSNLKVSTGSIYHALETLTRLHIVEVSQVVDKHSFILSKSGVEIAEKLNQIDSIVKQLNSSI